MGLNDEANEEFGLDTSNAPLTDREQEDTTVTLHATDLPVKTTNEVKDEEIFTKGVEPRVLPALDAEFVIQKSREDRLVEFTEKAAEVQAAGGISRNDVIALEAIMEEKPQEDNLKVEVEVEVETNPEEESSEEQSEETTQESEQMPQEAPRQAPRGFLGNQRMYTEQRSLTEFKPALQVLRTQYDYQYSNLKDSTLELSKKLFDLGKKELDEKATVYVDSVSAFNKKIIEFLNDFDSFDLKEVRCPFGRYLTWKDLCEITLHSLTCLKYPTSPNDDVDGKTKHHINSFNDTKAEGFISDLTQAYTKPSICGVMHSILEHNLQLFYLEGTHYHVKEDFSLYTPKSAEETIYHAIGFTITIGSIFNMFGTTNVNDFINLNLSVYQKYLYSLKEVEKEITNLEDNQDMTLKDKLDCLLEKTAKVHFSRTVMLGCLANIAALHYLFHIVTNFLNTLMGKE